MTCHVHNHVTKENMPNAAPLGESRFSGSLAGAARPGAPRVCVGGAEPRAEHH